ncbi:Heavy metal-associated domain superfamily [Arabidopsis suecica]|uniref:Heavy metal-associated domain superfamily n=1 Tax=Arabidopsis suecica TaxID=45249 RepID=A0A8T2AIZ1_ARASU|nr:Heavy metal-associated domain superfamily [Arabidopsis suecica]
MKEPMMRRRTLMLCEQLSLPSFQVIEINADVGCVCCQDRVSKIVSKMTGIEEYVVDLKKKLVMARGDFRPRLVSSHQQQVKDVVSQTPCQSAKRLLRPLNLFLRSIFSLCLRPCTL